MIYPRNVLCCNYLWIRTIAISIQKFNENWYQWYIPQKNKKIGLSNKYSADITLKHKLLTLFAHVQEILKF